MFHHQRNKKLDTFKESKTILFVNYNLYLSLPLSLLTFSLVSSSSIQFHIYLLNRITNKNAIGTSHQVIVINLVTILQDLPLDLRRIDPCDIILHVSCDQGGWVVNYLGTNADMTLLHKSNSSLKVRRHFVADHDDWEPPAAERGHAKMVAEGEALLGRDEAYAVELLEEVFCDFLTHRVVGLHGL